MEKKLLWKKYFMYIFCAKLDTQNSWVSLFFFFLVKDLTFLHEAYNTHALNLLGVWSAF